jgi:hypothetical protein
MWTGTIVEVIQSPDSVSLTVRFDKDNVEMFTKTYNFQDNNSLKNIKEIMTNEVNRIGDLQIEINKLKLLINKPQNLTLGK